MQHNSVTAPGTKKVFIWKSVKKPLSVIWHSLAKDCENELYYTCTQAVHKLSDKCYRTLSHIYKEMELFITEVILPCAEVLPKTLCIDREVYR